MCVRKQNGLALTLSTNYYAWTYGPTVILVVFASIWRQVDYHCKVIQPWSVMFKEPSPAATGVLLDYISPFQASSLLRAVKYRHWPVVCSVVGFVTLKLIVLSSTALLVSSPTTRSGGFNVVYQNDFNGSQMWRDVSDAIAQRIPTTTNSYWSSFDNVSSDAVSAYEKMLQGELSQPQNTWTDGVFQSFQLKDSEIKPSSMSADVDVFVPKITCEIGTVGTNNDIYSNSTYLQGEKTKLDMIMTIESPTCPLDATNHSTQVTALYCVGEDCPPWIVSYTINRVACSHDYPRNRSTSWEGAEVHDFRFVIMMANVTSDPRKFDFEHARIASSAAAFCKIDCEMHRASLDSDGDGFDLASDLGLSKGHHTDMTQLQFAELVYTCLDSGERSGWWGDESLASFSQELGATDALYRLMLLVSGLPMKEEYVGIFLDANKMIRAAKTVFTGVGVQFIQQNFLTAAVPMGKTTTASGFYQEDRLHLRMTSLWAMITGFFVMTVVAIGILLTGNHGVVPNNPATLAFHATALSNSRDLQGILADSGHRSTQQLRTLLSPYSFETTMSVRGLQLLSSKTTASAEKNTTPSSLDVAGKSAYSETLLATSKDHAVLPAGDGPQTTWAPLAAWLSVAGVMLITPLLAVAALEGLCRLSQRNNGLVNLDDYTYIESVAVYSTTLILLLVATLYNNLEFTTSVFAPFNTLRSGLALAKRSLHSNPLGKPAPVALSQMVRDRHLGAALSILAAMVGSTLAIVASGLWIVDSSARVELEASGSILSTWQTSRTNSSTDDDGAMKLLNDIHRNLSEPSVHVWHDLALPEFDGRLSESMSFNQNSLLETGLNYTFTMPSLRAELKCDVVPPESMFITYTEGNPNITHQSTWIFAALADVPSQCFQNYSGNPIGFRRTQGGAGRDSTPLSGWRAILLPIYELEPYDAVVKEPYLQENFTFPQNHEDESACPSFGVYHGYGGRSENYTIWDDGSVAENPTALVCYRRVQEIDATVVCPASVHGKRLDDQRPLSVETNEKDSRYLRNETADSDTFSYGIFPRVDDLEIFSDAYSETSNGYSNANIDAFFNHLFHMNPDITHGGLLGPERTTDLADAVAKMYREYMANVMDLNSRVPLRNADTSLTETTNGTATGFVSRPKMDPTAKLALQIMLIVMTLLGGLAFCLVDLRQTLPRDPRSIASIMALFAQSKLCSKEYMPEDATRMNKKELDCLWEGQRFSLGWWNIEDVGDEAEGRDRVRAPLMTPATVRSLDVAGNSNTTEVVPASLNDRSELSSTVKRKPLHQTASRECDNTDVSVSEEVEYREDKCPRIARQRFGIDLGTPVSFGLIDNGGWIRRVRRRLGLK